MDAVVETLRVLSIGLRRSFAHVNNVIDNVSPLYCAFSKDRLDLAEILLENGADINLKLYPDYDDVFRVHAVEAAGSVEAIRLGIRYGACHDSLCWLLSYFARNRNRRTCLFLIDAGARYNNRWLGIGYGRYIDTSDLRFVEELAQGRTALKRKIVALLGARKRSALLQRCGRDVVTLIAKTAWNERPRE